MKISPFDFLKSNKKIGLALGGGAVYGAAHLGVLKALEEKNIKVDYISGTSIGAFIAALYAFEIEISEIEKLILELKWSDISSVSLSKFAVLSNDKFGQVVEDALGNVEIQDASIPLAIVATDIANGEKVTLTEGNLSSAIKASTCIPGLFNPVNWGDQMLVDGGVVENLPVNSVKDFGADQIIAVDLNTGGSNRKPENIIDVLLNSFHFMLSSSSKKTAIKADVLIKPDLSEFNRYEVSQINELMNRGYVCAREVLAEWVND